MSVKLKIGCPLCGMSHWVPTINGPNGMLPVPMRPATLPDIKVVNTTSGGRARIRHHQVPIADFQDNGGAYTERAVLEQMICQANVVVAICEMRMAEL